MLVDRFTDTKIIYFHCNFVIGGGHKHVKLQKIKPIKERKKGIEMSVKKIPLGTLVPVPMTVERYSSDDSMPKRDEVFLRK